MHVLAPKPSTASFIAAVPGLASCVSEPHPRVAVRNPMFQSDMSLDLPCSMNLNPQVALVETTSSYRPRLSQPIFRRESPPNGCHPPKSAAKNNCCSSCVTHTSAAIVGFLLGIVLVLACIYFKAVILKEFGFVDNTDASSVPSYNVTSTTQAL